MEYFFIQKKLFPLPAPASGGHRAGLYFHSFQSFLLFPNFPLLPKFSTSFKNFPPPSKIEFWKEIPFPSSTWEGEAKTFEKGRKGGFLDKDSSAATCVRFF